MMAPELESNADFAAVNRLSVTIDLNGKKQIGDVNVRPDERVKSVERLFRHPGRRVIGDSICSAHKGAAGLQSARTGKERNVVDIDAADDVAPVRLSHEEVSEVGAIHVHDHRGAQRKKLCLVKTPAKHAAVKRKFVASIVRGEVQEDVDVVVEALTESQLREGDILLRRRESRTELSQIISVQVFNRDACFETGVTTERVRVRENFSARTEADDPQSFFTVASIHVFRQLNRGDRAHRSKKHENGN